MSLFWGHTCEASDMWADALCPEWPHPSDCTRVTGPQIPITLRQGQQKILQMIKCHV